jgi:hypothetical protein
MTTLTRTMHMKNPRTLPPFLLLLPLLLPPPARAEILTGPDATPLETYAAREFQRYHHQLTGVLLPLATAAAIAGPAADPAAIADAAAGPLVLIGTPASLPLLSQFPQPAADPGPQGYFLKTTTTHAGRPVLIISGADPDGVRNGVYGYLDEHCGIGFHFDGDVLPPAPSPAAGATLGATTSATPAAAAFPAVDETKTPAQSIRGFLPWSNFPQSPSSFTWEDWVFVIDQAAKMRFNLIHLHNYSGDFGHNEMFHSFWAGGKTRRVWFATGRSGYGGTKGFDLKRYLGRSAELLDDYDTGGDTGLHNEGLTDAQVFRKGVAAFQRILDHAHARGIKIALGIDLTDTVNQYPAPDTDPELVRNRSAQLAADYPGLDCLVFFVSERIKQKPALWPRWKTIFDAMHAYLKTHSPALRYGVSGWGDAPTAAQAATLPPDVVCAQIAGYSAGFDPGEKYGAREYWGCPWLECDINSSQWYYPYRMHLSDTIAAYRRRAANMTGLYCLTWRLTDAIAPKIWYIARAPWDTRDELKTSRDVYHRFAQRWYGAQAADAITGIINENEPEAARQSECGETLPFAPPVEKDAPPLFALHAFSFTAKKGGSAFAPALDARTKDSGVKTIPLNGKPAIAGIDSGDWAAWPLPSDKKDETRWDTFTATVTPGKNGGKIEVRYKSPDGEKLAEILVPPAAAATAATTTAATTTAATAAAATAGGAAAAAATSAAAGEENPAPAPLTLSGYRHSRL